ncbi:hypothetical protein [Streptomyces sp. NPDC003710]
MVWIRKVAPAEALQEVTHLRGLARLRIPKDWTVEQRDGVTTAEAAGIGRLSVRARIVDNEPGPLDDAGSRLPNGCILRTTDDREPLPDRPARRVRRREVVQPIGEQVRVLTFIFDYDVGWRHATALGVLGQEIPAVVPQSA